MKLKSRRKAVDILMVIMLPLLMAYSLAGETAHELLGILMFALFIAHHILNRKWWLALVKGKNVPARAARLTVDTLLAIYMILQPVSGILMSKHILTGITIAGASASMRTIHMTCAYWGFVLMSVHIGLHAAAMSTYSDRVQIRKSEEKESTVFNDQGNGRSGQKHSPLFSSKASQIAAAAISIYGIYAFIHRGLADYLFMKVQFAYFDPNASLILFLLDYAAIIILIAAITFCLCRLISKPRQKVS